MFAAISRFFSRRLTAVALCSLAVTSAMIVLYTTQPQIIRQVDHKAYDLMLPLLRGEPSPVPVVIDIDEESLRRYGQWPWPRYLLAKLVIMLAERESACIALDILLAEPDRASPQLMRQYLQRDLDVSIGFTGLPEGLDDYDALLAEVVSGLPVVLGGYARFSGRPDEDADFPPPLRYALLESPDATDIMPGLPKAAGATFALPGLRRAAPSGMVNMTPDMDGILREVPLIIRLGDNLYPGLSLRALMTSLGRNAVTLGAGPDGLSFVKVGPHTMAVDPRGNARVPYQGPRKSYPYYRALDVLEGRVDADKLRGRVAFVGTSAPGLMDIRATPFDRVYPGVEVHAAMLDAMLTGRHVLVPPWAPGLQALAIALCGLVCGAVFGFSGPRVYLPVGLALAGGCIAASRHFFLGGMYVSPVYPVLTVAALAATLLLVRFVHEEKQKKLLRTTFSRYVAPEVVNRITRLSGDIFAGEERELTIMFTDIRGFTSISEKLGPKQIVDLLSRYFTPMTAIVRGNSGTLDKFIGDALMAFWNAPLDVPQHPALAVKSALAMRAELEALNVELKREFDLELAMGVGLHTGLAYVGNMGSKELVNYTLIGDAVNLASRLEGLCSRYGAGLVLSEDTRRGCGEAYAFQPLDVIRVKGKKQPVAVFTALEKTEYAARSGEMRLWEQAFALYQAGDFTQLPPLLEGLRREHPGVALYAVYAERAHGLLENVPANWDGVWTMTQK